MDSESLIKSIGERAQLQEPALSAAEPCRKLHKITRVLAPEENVGGLDQISPGAGFISEPFRLAVALQRLIPFAFYPPSARLESCPDTKEIFETRSRQLLRSECGASLLELAIMLPVLLLIFMGTVDFGRAYYFAPEVAGAANAAAIYGSSFPTDLTGMAKAAALNAPDVSGLTTTTAWGCECSDGTNQVVNCSPSAPTCSVNVVYYVTVTTSASFTPLIPWPGIPSPMTISRSTVMRGGTPY